MQVVKSFGFHPVHGRLTVITQKNFQSLQKNKNVSWSLGELKTSYFFLHLTFLKLLPFASSTTLFRSFILISWKCNNFLNLFRSWTFDGITMGFDFFQNKQEMDVSSFFSQKVKITSNTGVLENKIYPCCVEPYLSIKYTMGFSKA